jgi:hypothetical protein
VDRRSDAFSRLGTSLVVAIAQFLENRSLVALAEINTLNQPRSRSGTCLE